MSTVPPAAGTTPAIPPLLRHLVDDAALFPPGNAPMAVAVREHRHHRAAPYAELVGPLLCPASRFAELVDELTAQPGPAFPLGLIGDTGPDRLADTAHRALTEPRVTLRQLECAVPASSADLAAATREVAELLFAIAPADQWLESFLEIPRVAGWSDAVRAVGEFGNGNRVFGAKLRTGGPTADAFPTEAELADFLALNIALDQPFKLTAGLHHAVRHTAPDTGFEHHGYLNVLAVVAAPLQPDRADTDPRDLLGCRAGAALVEMVRPVLDSGDGTEARTWFASYGSCSVAEPLTDLVELGLLDRSLLSYLPPARKERM